MEPNKPYLVVTKTKAEVHKKTMGNSLCMLCSDSPKHVMVMRADGTLIKFTAGIRAKEVTGAHTGHVIVRCALNCPVIPNSAELDPAQLYFLMPEDSGGLAESFEEFRRVAESKGLVPSRVKPRHEPEGTTINGQVIVGQFFLFEGSELRRSPWRPKLQTIPEVVPPSISQN
ncbi:hypothetical protein QJS10_CPA07g01357 [Acorus calamus]|uniref:Uncharacterized protein n=1 Tax=Acorus calamus TaxID=4465 RepID=A0AAV9EHS2_ACOCL|nr:hypothetical protein QJS10_CPA07g01357 [Acorus calamus]